jgi:cytochrome c556
MSLIKTTPIVFAICTTTALAHGAATGIVRERMDSMVVLGKTMKSLSLMAKSDAQLDKAALETAAQTIQDHSGENLTKLFPAGSTKHSDATPLVWSQSDEFKKLSQDLAELSRPLKHVTTKSDLVESIQAIGQSCKSCHARFRQKSDE